MLNAVLTAVVVRLSSGATVVSVSFAVAVELVTFWIAARLN